MLSWLRKQAKPFAALGLAGLLGQSLMLCCINTARAEIGATTSHCHPTANAAQAHDDRSRHNAEETTFLQLAGAGSDSKHCPPTEKKSCCDDDARVISRDDVAIRGLAQTVDLNLDWVALPAREFAQQIFVQPPLLRLGTPLALASPGIFLIHCAFLE